MEKITEERDISDFSNSELISLIFSNPFIPTEVREMAMREYNKRLKELYEVKQNEQN